MSNETNLQLYFSDVATTKDRRRGQQVIEFPKIFVVVSHFTIIVSL